MPILAAIPSSGRIVGEEESARLWDVYWGLDPYEHSEEERRDYPKGFYFRDFVTRLGVLGLKIARTRAKSFLPAALGASA